MKKNCMSVFLGCSLILSVFFLTADSFEKSKGQVIFEAKNCNMCHSVSTVKIEAKTKSDKLKGPDLVNLAEKYEADWISKYIQKEIKKEGKAHPKSFSATDEEVRNLVDWLLEQKAEG